MNSFLELLSSGSAYKRCVGTGPRFQDPKTLGITRRSVLVYEDRTSWACQNSEGSVRTGELPHEAQRSPASEPVGKFFTVTGSV